MITDIQHLIENLKDILRAQQFIENDKMVDY